MNIKDYYIKRSILLTNNNKITTLFKYTPFFQFLSHEVLYAIHAYNIIQDVHKKRKEISRGVLRMEK